MRNKVKAFYKTATLLFAVLGLFGLIYCGVIAIKLADVLKYTNWLETGSVASAAIIGSFSCAACVFGGIYGFINRNNRKKMGGCIAIAVMSIAYFAASCFLCIQDARIVIVSIAGIILSCFYILAAYLFKNSAEDDKNKDRLETLSNSESIKR